MRRLLIHRIARLQSLQRGLELCKKLIGDYLSLLKRGGTLCTVGLPPSPIAVSAFSVVQGRKNFSGSNIGGIKETQEMLDFCSKHNIVSDIEITSFDKIEEAWERVIKSDVKYRFVLDLKTLKS
jgi:uncharacterized zinc-type alcohol dehydrogenase-like protein